MKAFFHDLYVKIKTNVTNAIALLGTMLGGVMSHIDSLLGWVFSNIDAFAATLGDPNLNHQMAIVISDAKWIGRWMFAVGIVATVAKFKALVQSPPKV